MRFDEYDFAKPYISDGEKILWQGKPARGIHLTVHDICFAGFGILWCGLLLGSSSSLLQSGDARVQIPVLAFMFCFGFGSTIGKVIYSKLILFRTAYVITSRKIIRRRGSKIDTLEGRDMPEIRVEARKNGNGTIRFGYVQSARSARRRITVTESNPGIFALENIPDVAKVQQIIYGMTSLE